MKSKLGAPSPEENTKYPRLMQAHLTEEVYLVTDPDYGVLVAGGEPADLGRAYSYNFENIKSFRYYGGSVILEND